jgi:hypothetical protein
LQVNLSFRNANQEAFYFSKFRNNEFDGAFQNGKTYTLCMRAFTHLSAFPNYAYSFCRQEYKALRSTTMKTFFKICPDEAIFKHDTQNGYTVFKNKSFIYWMHLDEYDEQDLRGLEINSAGIDQAEEIQEPIYNVLDARIGRWDKAQVPEYLLINLLSEKDAEHLARMRKNRRPQNEIAHFIKANTKWPRHSKWGHFLVPNFLDVACNIADDEEFHWSYRFYNPESYERKPDHFYVHGEMDVTLGDEKTYQQMLLRDQEWVNKYVKGRRGTTGATIHRLDDSSIIKPKDYSPAEFNAFIAMLKSRAALYRILDHGETGITAVGWLAILYGMHIFYREYYAERKLVSENRKAIHELSFGEEYFDDIADPQIGKKTQQSISGLKAGFWSVQMEYADIDEISDAGAPPIFWTLADNNEFATRNRINELLVLNSKYSHPITKVSPAPGLYFIQKDINLYPHGVQEGIIQIKQQRRKLLGEDNGKKIYSEERDERIIDHAYDYIRYGVAMHNTNKDIPKKKPKRMTFEYYNQILARRPKRMPASID